MMSKTQPLPLGVDPVKDAPLLLEGRYGTREMCDIWGTDANAYLAVMQAQVAGLDTLNDLYSGRIPQKYVEALRKTANLTDVNPDLVRDLEAKGEHDVIAINTAWGQAADKVEPGASSVTNFLRTSADSTETGKAIRCMGSFRVYANSVENLRDIVLEKSIEWIDKPFMDQTHLYDALPTIAGRPLSYYAEVLQSNLDFMKLVHDFSLFVKWADATGNHHSAATAGIDGMRMQEAYARRLGIRCMIAPAQVPAREFNADIMYALARAAMTLSTMGEYIARHRGDDVNVFQYARPKKKKGSSSMPHKDVKNGNPTAEEQAESLGHALLGKLTTAVASIKFRYGRDLSGSASDRIDVGPAFKFSDHVARRMADVVYWIQLDEGRSLERIFRSYGVVTSPQILTCLTDPAVRGQPLSRAEAHDLVGELATRAYQERQDFFYVLRDNPVVSSRLGEQQLREMSNPAKYIGQSREIIEKNYADLHGRKTFPPTL